MIRQNYLLISVVGTLSITMLCACGASKYYGVEYSYRETTSGGESNMTAAPAPVVRAVVHRSNTVAFLPPDACREIHSTPTGSSQVSQILRLQCGPLMANLEDAASKAGFQVVSWQSLRGADRPIKYAREQGVDLLFEINELSINEVDKTITTVATPTSGLSFFESESENGNERTPIELSRSALVRDRCLAAIGLFHVPRQIPLRHTVTLNVKMVSVSDGQVRWHYQRTNGPTQLRDGRQAYVYEVQAKQSTLSKGLLWGGIALAGVGLATMGAGYAVFGPSSGTSGIVPTAPMAADSKFLPIMALGGTFFALGGGLAIAGLITGRNSRYAGPEQVLCVREPVWRSANTVQNVPESESHLLVEAVRLFVDSLRAIRSQP